MKLPNLSDRELDIMYQDFLRECFDTVKICGHEYDAAYALKNTDPTAYRCGLADWLDAEMTEGNIVEDDGDYYLKEVWDNQSDWASK